MERRTPAKRKGWPPFERVTVSRLQRRALVWAFILLGHALLIYGMTRGSTLPRVFPVHEAPIASMMLIFIDPSELRGREPQSTRSDTFKISPSAASIEIAAITLPIQAEGVAQPEAAIDWVEEGKEAARRLPNVSTDPQESTDREPKGIFERETTRHRAGDIEVIGQGIELIERRWINSRCYREFGNMPELRASAGPKVNPIRCNLGSSVPDGSLFDHLKPDYLKRK